MCKVLNCDARDDCYDCQSRLSLKIVIFCCFLLFSFASSVWALESGAAVGEYGRDMPASALCGDWLSDDEGIEVKFLADKTFVWSRLAENSVLKKFNFDETGTFTISPENKISLSFIPPECFKSIACLGCLHAWEMSMPKNAFLIDENRLLVVMPKPFRGQNLQIFHKVR